MPLPRPDAARLGDGDELVAMAVVPPQAATKRARGKAFRRKMVLLNRSIFWGGIGHLLLARWPLAIKRATLVHQPGCQSHLVITPHVPERLNQVDANRRGNAESARQNP